MSMASEVMKLIFAVLDVPFNSGLYTHCYKRTVFAVFSTKFLYILTLVPDFVKTKRCKGGNDRVEYSREREGGELMEREGKGSEGNGEERDKLKSSELDPTIRLAKSDFQTLTYISAEH